MKTLAAKEAKLRFGQIPELVQREPVRVTKQGRPVFVALSVSDYEIYEQFRAKARQTALNTLASLQEEAIEADLTPEQTAELLNLNA